MRQKQAAPLGYDRLRRVLDGLGDRPADLRDAALLALAYDTLARRSELVVFDLADLGRDADGSGTALIRRSKTDYYDGYFYLPLYIFCGDRLLATKLRRANIDASAGATEEVARIVAQIRAR